MSQLSWYYLAGKGWSIMAGEDLVHGQFVCSVAAEVVTAVIAAEREL